MSGNCNPLPQSWVHAALDDCCHVILGQSPPGESYNDSGKGMPFFQGKADFRELYPTVRKWCIQPGKIAERDDVLISVRAPVGPTNLCPGNACIGRGLAALRALGGSAPRYILYALRNTQAQLAAQGTGSTFEAINGDQLRAHRIPIAPKEEQDRIVAEIEKQFTRLDDAVAALKRVRANLKRYRASVLKAACEGRLVPTEAELARKEGRSYESGEQLLARILRECRAKWEAHQLATMLAAGKPADDERWKHDYREPVRPNVAALPRLPEGWEWACADQLLSHVTSGSRNWADHYCEHGALFIRAQDIKTDTLDLSSPAHVQLPQGAEGIRTRVRGDDILVTITGANVSKTARVTQAPAEAYVSQHVALLRPVLPLISPFLYHWIVSPANGRRDLLTKAYGAGKPGLNLDNIRELPVPLPPADEQVRITKELDIRFSALERFAELIGRNLDRSTGLRHASLKTAFSGRLVPQDPSDEPASVLLERIRAERAATGKAPVQRRSASAR